MQRQKGFCLLLDVYRSRSYLLSKVVLCSTKNLRTIRFSPSVLQQKVVFRTYRKKEKPTFLRLARRSRPLTSHVFVKVSGYASVFL